MVQQRKPTPEEQLLKLIETPQGKPAADQSQSAPAAAVKTKAAVSYGKLPGIFEYWKKQFAQGKAPVLKPRSGPGLFIKKFNLMLVAGVIAALIYLALDLTVFKTDEQNYLAMVSTQDAVYAARKGKLAEEVRDVAYYRDMVTKRNPFTAAGDIPVVAEEPKGDEVPSKAAPTTKIGEKLQGLNLVGISWSKDNPMAMIEDVPSGKTFFLKQGQEINGIKLQNISKEKVIVTYEGEESSLF